MLNAGGIVFYLVLVALVVMGGVMLA